MVQANYNGPTVIAIKVSSVTGSVTVKANATIRMGVTMLENTKTTSHQGKVFTNGRTGRVTRENGKVASSMAKESRSCLMEQSLMVIGTWDYQKALASASIQMEAHTMGIGSKDSHTVLERRHYQTGPHMKEDG